MRNKICNQEKKSEDKFLHIEKDGNGKYEVVSKNLSPMEEFKMIEKVIESLGERVKEELRVIHAKSIKDLIEYDKNVRSDEKKSD